MNISFLFLAIPILLIVWLIILYNRLVRHKFLVRESWSGVDVQLKRRTDLIPNLVDTIREYMKHERKLLNEVTELRAKSMTARGIQKRGQAENALSRSLTDLFAVVEAYPTLKANENFLNLQNQLGEIEEQIQLARRYYNGTVRNLNILIESFPSNIVAKMFHFTKREYFEIEDTDRAVPTTKI